MGGIDDPAVFILRPLGGKYEIVKLRTGSHVPQIVDNLGVMSAVQVALIQPLEGRPADVEMDDDIVIRRSEERRLGPKLKKAIDDAMIPGGCRLRQQTVA